MKTVLVLASFFLIACQAYSKDTSNEYKPEDHVIVDESGKIKIIEDEIESPKLETEKQNKGRVCLTLRMDENDNILYEVKKCEKNP